MATKNKATARREADKVKKARKVAERTVYADSDRIKVVGDYEPRKGKKTEKFMTALRKSATVGDYKAKRARMGIKGGVGHLFAALVERGVVQVKHAA